MSEDKKRELFNKAHVEQLAKQAKNYDRQEWNAILKEAPVEGLFYALMHKIMRILDMNRKYEAVKGDIDRVYADDELSEWL